MNSCKWIAASVLLCMPVAAADVSAVESWLKKPIITDALPLKQVQAFTERQVQRLPEFTSKRDWQHYARDLRKEVLDEVVFRGEARQWRKGKTRFEYLQTLETGPGYRIRQLRYEALPGFWIPALIYEPEKMNGQMPVALNVNGHDGKGKAAPYKQIRCITLARQGVIALNTEWIGMGQLGHADNRHYRMNQLDLCGTSGLAPFYLAMERALDVLLAHPNADPKRVAVAGLSGGGWQTIVISALDERVTLANPVAGYSSFRTRARQVKDLGDSEQTPADLAAIADYTHLTALLAPRPALLTFNEKDNCCFAAADAQPLLMEAATPIYKLFNAENHLRTHVNVVPGDHNFGEDNRRALYGMIGDHFFPGNDTFVREDQVTEGELKSVEALTVPLPPDNGTLHSLASALSADLPREGKLPTRVTQAQRWQESGRETLDQVIQSRPYRATTFKEPESDLVGAKVRQRRFSYRRDWTVPGVEFEPLFSRATTILIHDAGRQAASKEVASLLDRQHRVIAVDLFYFGESKIKTRDFLYALLVAATGERPLGLQCSQLNGIARWARQEFPEAPVVVEAHGERSSLIALAAAAVNPQFIEGVTLHGSLGSLKEIIENNWSVDQKPELFCFGLLEAFDIRQLTAMVAPRPVTFVSPSDRVKSELDGLSAWYALLGRKHDPIQAKAEGGAGGG